MTIKENIPLNLEFLANPFNWLMIGSVAALLWLVMLLITQSAAPPPQQEK